MAELKPCPFCGDKQHLVHVELSNGLHYVECKRCGAAPHRLGAWDRETAVKYWNSVNRWIPCSERLPDIDVPVLTWDGQYISVERRIEYFLYNDEETGHIERQYGEYWIDGVEGDEENPIGLRDGTATYWMPLPEPPKE